MEIIREGPEWTSEDVSNFRAWLDTQTGRRLLPKLAESAPPLLAGGNTNDILIRSGDLRGFQLAVRTLLGMTEVEQAPPRRSDNFPSLDEGLDEPEKK